MSIIELGGRLKEKMKKLGFLSKNLKNFKCLKGSFPPRQGSNHTYKVEKKTFLEKLTTIKHLHQNRLCKMIHINKNIACIYFSKIYTMLTGNITERIDADEEKYLEKVNLYA